MTKSFEQYSDYKSDNCPEISNSAPTSTSSSAQQQWSYAEAARTTDNCHGIEKCTDKKRRINLKNKRVKNYIKKGIELAAMLDMDVYLMLNDRDQGRLSQYCSGDSNQGHFTIEKATKFLDDFKLSGGQMRFFDDNDYNKVKLSPTEHNDGAE